MQLRKYGQFIANNPQLLTCLDQHIGTGRTDSNSGMTRAQWIEQQVKYLAVRPFESLDLQTARNVRGNGTVCTTTEYTVWFHISGQPLSSRARSLYNEPTFPELFTQLADWFGIYWALQPECSLQMEFITRRTKWFGGSRHFQEAIEFFLFPQGFTLDQWKTPSPQDETKVTS